jgi:D-arginine dehydrogenase
MRRSAVASADVIIVGGGVAGLSAARALAEKKLRVLLLEREPQLATQASGNNAAIFRPFEHEAASALLPRRSRQLLEAWFGTALLEITGLVLVSHAAEPVSLLAAAAMSGGVAHSVLDGSQLRALAPSLAGGEARHALLLHEGGVLDVPALTTGLARQARAMGAELRTNVAVQAFTQARGRITGVTLAGGEQLAASSVIVAAGAWNASLGEVSGAEMPLVPLRRHLIELETHAAIAAAEPVVWRLEDEVYYRKQGSGVLASPCDESRATLTVSSSAPAISDASAAVTLNDKLQRTAPELADGSIVRAWACLRTFAHDRELVLGSDPRVQGLYWFGGLGGRGMSVAPAAAEWLSACVLGEAVPPAAAALSPARLLSAQSSADRTA